MNPIVCDPQGTDLHRSDEENLFIDHLCPALESAISIETVRTYLDTNTDAEYFVYLFACGIDLTDTNPEWIQRP